MRAILIDDEDLALKYLEYQLIMIGDFEIVGKYTDPLQGRQAVMDNEVDIVFLDVHMPEMNGIELAGILLETKPFLNVVFITAYEEYAIKAFELNALDYVLKPILLERLKRTARRISQRVRREIASSSAPKHWKLQLFGEFMIIDERQEARSLNWRTSKAQELFFYLLHHRGKVIGKAVLIELLWADFELQKAFSQLYTAVYHIRKTLEVFGSHIALQNVADGYLLRLEGMDIDLDRFDRFIQSKIALSDDTISEYEGMLNLYKGEYLEGADYDWAEYERQKHRLQWIRLKLALAEWFYERQQPDKAFKHCDNLRSRFPMEEQAQSLYLKICEGKTSAFLT